MSGLQFQFFIVKIFMLSYPRLSTEIDLSLDKVVFSMSLIRTDLGCETHIYLKIYSVIAGFHMTSLKFKLHNY